MIKKTLKRYSVWLMMLLALCQMGTIRRDEDPILKAQTDPIELKQKLEETKDGVKGAPTPSFKYYEKEDFLTRSPMKSALEEETPKSKPQNDLDAITEVETQPEATLQEQEPGTETPVAAKSEETSKEEDDWWVEDPT